MSIVSRLKKTSFQCQLSSGEWKSVVLRRTRSSPSSIVPSLCSCIKASFGEHLSIYSVDIIRVGLSSSSGSCFRCSSCLSCCSKISTVLTRWSSSTQAMVNCAESYERFVTRFENLCFLYNLTLHLAPHLGVWPTCLFSSSLVSGEH